MCDGSASQASFSMGCRDQNENSQLVNLDFVADPWSDLMARLARSGVTVPKDVDVGYPLCLDSVNDRMISACAFG